MKNITIILGENGKGKTRSLLKIFEAEKNNSYIAVISNSLINKFPKIQSKKIKQYLISSTHAQTDNYESFLYGEFNKIITPFNVVKALNILEYLGFEPLIRIMQKPNYTIKIDINNEIIMRKISTESSIGATFNQKKITKTVSNEYSDYIQKEHHFEINKMSNDGIDKYSRHLIRSEIIKEKTKIEDDLFSTRFFLKKNEMEFPLSQASSGELYMLAIGLFIMKFITGVGDDNNNKLILIDEPENSLHPKWQREYIQNIIGFIGEREVDIYIATHSPFIAIPNNIDNANIKIATVNEGELKYIDSSQGLNIEEIYYDYFGILTPKNRYLSEYCESLLKRFTLEKISFEKANNLLEDMKNASNDSRQISFIESIIELLLKLQEKRL
ncbi:AAA family ATPase [Citrobacter sp. RHB25-C09]|uniref:AAA family ATPase n=1 Tax=Citrobacter sp. RHB25-C09 TaxID=2742624 RepID=UPI0015EFC3C6|nr:AAA family ATPase [Citrobacter sp. RHB25-C09]QMI04919.1 ATP-binding protein [Citrobacter sp. RHB25-C09]